MSIDSGAIYKKLQEDAQRRAKELRDELSYHKYLLYVAYKDDFDRFATAITEDTLTTEILDRDYGNLNPALLQAVEQEHGLDLLGMAALSASNSGAQLIPWLVNRYRAEERFPELSHYLFLSNTANNWPASLALLDCIREAAPSTYEQQKVNIVVSMCRDYPNCDLYRQRLLPLPACEFTTLTQVRSFQAMAIPFLLAHSKPDSTGIVMNKIKADFPAAFEERTYDHENSVHRIIKCVQFAALAFYLEGTKRFIFPTKEYTEVNNLLNTLFEQKDSLKEEEVMALLKPFFTLEKKITKDTFRCQLMLALLGDEAFCNTYRIPKESMKKLLTPAAQFEEFIRPFQPVDIKEFTLL